MICNTLCFNDFDSCSYKLFNYTIELPMLSFNKLYSYTFYVLIINTVWEDVVKIVRIFRNFALIYIKSISGSCVSINIVCRILICIDICNTY